LILKTESEPKSDPGGRATTGKAVTMQTKRYTGPDSGVLKYDILTALSALALNGSKTLQTSMLRLIALITARYNWRADELTVGQRDMARLWAVNERTVKREMKRLTDSGILTCLRSGVRGRVGAYRLNIPRIAEMSQALWPNVGPDFDDRMRARYAAAQSKVVSLAAFSANAGDAALDSAPGTWSRVMSNLARSHPDIYKAWFTRLEFLRFEHGTLHLRAPGTFIRKYIETHLMAVMITEVETELGPVEAVRFH